jgi:hypothetical protein
MNQVNPFTPMSFYMLDYSLAEAEALLKNSKLLNEKQKQAILAEYSTMLAQEHREANAPTPQPTLTKSYKSA